MGIFGDDRTEEIEILRQQVVDGDVKRKNLAQELAAERKRIEAMGLALARANAELAYAKRAVQQARQRQKASVARANRFKAKLEPICSVAQGA
jgi:chromosome segregation ATPase